MNGDRPALLRGNLPSFFSFAAIVACLYFAREFLLPVILAALLSFLLAPLVSILERWRLGRIPSVLIVSLLAFLSIGALTYLMVSQLMDFAAELPKYRHNLMAKVQSLRDQTGGPLGSAMQTVQEVLAALNPPDQKNGASAPVPVVVQSTTGATSVITGLIVPILGPLGTAAIVSVLVIFMLLGHEDLRDRLIHLVGRGHLRITTEALDEAGKRVSRYLRAQLMVNVLYGVPVGIGLFFIGVPNAALWGVLATLLRFLPYVGPWIAAMFPLALSLAVSESWNQLFLTGGLFVVMELISNNVVEPWLYGASTGLSPFAVIISAFFWTWIWGPIGLLLATPLTVCVAVAGKHVPGLAFLDVLLGDKPPISRSERLYQRILALDEEEACEIAEETVKEQGLVPAIDHVLLPTLHTMEIDNRNGVLPEKNRAAAVVLFRELCTELAAPIDGAGGHVLCLPALNEADELAASLLCEALQSRGAAASVPSSKLLISESIEHAAKSNAAVICVVNFPPLSVLVVGNLCQRLQEKLPNAYITAVLWQPNGDGEEISRRRERLKRRGAYDVFSNIESALPTLAQLAGCKPTRNGQESEQEEEAPGRPASVP